MATSSKTQQAIAWILEDPKRSQQAAADKFGIKQATVSLGLKSWRRRNPEATAPDARRKT